MTDTFTWTDSLELNTNCYLAKNEVTGGHCFVFTIAGPSLHDHRSESSENRHLQAKALRSHHLWQSVGSSEGDISGDFKNPSDYVNDLVRCKDMRKLYDIASKYGPLVGLSERGAALFSRFDASQCFGSGLEGAKLWGGGCALTAENVFADRSTNSDSQTALNLAEPNAQRLIEELFIDSFHEMRSYPKAAKAIANSKSFTKRTLLETATEAVYAEPVVDWLILRNLTQLVGRILIEMNVLDDEAVRPSSGGILTQCGFSHAPFTMPVYRLGGLRRNNLTEMDRYPETELPKVHKGVMYFRQIAALNYESVEFLREAIGRPLEDDVRAPSKTTGAAILAAWRALGQVSPLLGELCVPYIAKSSQGREVTRSLALIVQERRLFDLRDRRRMHIIFGCQALAKQLSLPLKENGVYLALESQPSALAPLFPPPMQTQLMPKAESIAASNAIVSVINYLRDHIGIDDEHLLDDVRHERLHYGEMRCAPQWLADKALFAMIGHEGRRLNVCKNCGRITLAPTRGKPRQFCSTSCQHMYAKKFGG